MKYALLNLSTIALTIFGTYQFQEYRWTGIMQEQQIEAAQKLQELSQKVLEQERIWRKEIVELESAYNESETRLSVRDREYRSLVRTVGGLRDKANRCSGGTSQKENTSASGNNETSTTVLSREATDFLLDITAEADQMREQLLLCQKWAEKMKMQ